ncbi:MAG: thiamine pyrophosphate-requiring protein [Thermomicrobiales bacterium]
MNGYPDAVAGGGVAMSGERTVGDVIVERLQAWGVKRLFGYSGEGINGLLGALNRAGSSAGNEPEFFQVRHEESAALMACGHAKFSGQPGVVVAMQGPGAVHILNGLYDAKLDHQPVVAIVGQVSRMAEGSNVGQEVDSLALFRDVASDFCEMATNAAAVPHIIDRAFRVATARRSVAVVILPHDLQNLLAGEESVPASTLSVPITAPARMLPPEDALQRAADVLNAGERVAILVGAGALHATDEVVAVAETLGAGIAKALLGKAAVPDDIPFVTGAAGWLGTAASNRMLAECDTLFMIGTNFPYVSFLPKPGQARGVQIDLDAGTIGVRYPIEAGLPGDSAETLRALLPLLTPKANRQWRERIEANVLAWRTDAVRRANELANPINPQKLFTTLSPRLPDRAMLCSDSGSSTVWFGRHLQMRLGMTATVSGTLMTMGCALPYALAAKLAHPDRPAFAFLGDGAMQMNGLGELLTVADTWRRWDDPRLIVLVLNNRDLGFVTWEQRAMEGDARFGASQGVPEFPYARYAEMLGLRGILLEDAGRIEAVWDEALAADRPVLIEAITDPSVPTLPPEPEAAVLAKIARALATESGVTATQVRTQLGREGHAVES